jgi:hypothetical protein
VPSSHERESRIASGISLPWQHIHGKLVRNLPVTGRYPSAAGADACVEPGRFRTTPIPPACPTLARALLCQNVHASRRVPRSSRRRIARRERPSRDGDQRVRRNPVTFVTLIRRSSGLYYRSGLVTAGNGQNRQGGGTWQRLQRQRSGMQGSGELATRLAKSCSSARRADEISRLICTSGFDAADRGRASESDLSSVG